MPGRGGRGGSSGASNAALNADEDWMARRKRIFGDWASKQKRKNPPAMIQYIKSPAAPKGK